MKRFISVVASVSMLAVAGSATAGTAAVATRLEAESASFFHATVDSDHAGFSGTGGAALRAPSDNRAKSPRR
jgi:hypothetical protein